MIASGLDWLAVLAALALAGIFAVAAIAKLRSPKGTAADFASLGLPWADGLAVVVPVVELATAGLLVLAPGWGGVLATVLLVGFTANLVLVIRSGRVATCACFGGSSGEPVAVRHVIRNGLFLALALSAISVDGWIWSLL